MTDGITCLGSLIGQHTRNDQSLTDLEHRVHRKTVCRQQIVTRDGEPFRDPAAGITRAYYVTSGVCRYGGAAGGTTSPGDEDLLPYLDESFLPDAINRQQFCTAYVKRTGNRTNSVTSLNTILNHLFGPALRCHGVESLYL